MGAGHGHGHAHGDHDHVTPPRLRRLLLVAVLPLVLATLVGLVLLWPSSDKGEPPLGYPAELVDGTVVRSEPTFCAGSDPAAEIICPALDIELTSGPDAGDTITVEDPGGSVSPKYQPGDRLVLGYIDDLPPGAPPGTEYTLTGDYQRKAPLGWLALLFALAVVVLGRWRGLSALAGLGVSLFVLLTFVLPALLEGRNPLLVAVVGASAIMFVALYLAHGFTSRTTTAVLGTLASLVLTGLLGWAFVGLTRLTGLASEDARFLTAFNADVNVQGLILAGIVIGSLGVLDDVTVTQVSAVWELHLANPATSARGLYRAALRIGRDHIASTVNTLVLAYAGASLSLLVLFSESGQRLADVINGETVATEVVRTLVGSIGLVASVPITTALAVLVVRAGEEAVETHGEGDGGGETHDHDAHDAHDEHGHDHGDHDHGDGEAAGGAHDDADVTIPPTVTALSDATAEAVMADIEEASAPRRPKKERSFRPSKRELEWRGDAIDEPSADPFATADRDDEDESAS